MKTLGFVFTSTFLITQLVVTHLAFAGPWPALETEQQKLEYGLAVRAQTKPFFSKTFNFGMEWWHIANEQERIQKELKGLYPASDDTRPLMTLTLSKLSVKQMPSADVLKTWQLSILETLSEQPEQATRADLIHELNAKSEFLQKTKPGELLNRLLGALQMSKDEKGEVMRRTVEAKIDYLKERLPDDIAQTSFFKDTKGQFSAEKTATKQKALEFLNLLYQAEADAPKLVSVLVATAHQSKTTSVHALKLAVQQMSPTELSKMLDGVDMSKALTGAVDEKWSANIFSKTLQRLSEQGSTEVTVRTPSLHLVEIPRDLSILKSSIGDDCSHTCSSFAKSDHPDVRVFYIRDQMGTDIGYVQSELKTVNGSDVLYVMAIQGPKVTAQQAEEILFMLEEQRAAIGVEKIVIAKGHTGSMMNYASVINYLDSLIEGRPVVHAHPRKPVLTQVIERHLINDYLMEAVNTEGVIYEPAASVRENEVTLETRENKDVIQQKLNARDVTLFALELDATQRWSTVAGHLTDGERAITTAGMDLESYRSLRSHLRNSGRLSYQDFLNDIHPRFAKLGITVDQNFIKERPYLFYEGQLSASDAVSDQLRKSSLAILGQFLKRPIWYAPNAMMQFGREPGNVLAADQSKELDSLFDWVNGDLETHSYVLMNIANAGIGLDRIRNPKTIRSLLRVVARGDMWPTGFGLAGFKNLYPNLLDLAQAMRSDSDPGVKAGLRKILDQERGQRKSSRALTCPALLAGGRQLKGA